MSRLEQFGVMSMATLLLSVGGCATGGPTLEYAPGSAASLTATAAPNQPAYPDATSQMIALASQVVNQYKATASEGHSRRERDGSQTVIDIVPLAAGYSAVKAVTAHILTSDGLPDPTSPRRIYFAVVQPGKLDASQPDDRAAASASVTFTPEVNGTWDEVYAQGNDATVPINSAADPAAFTMENRAAANVMVLTDGDIPPNF